jgi:hypothetical protein
MTAVSLGEFTRLGALKAALYCMYFVFFGALNVLLVLAMGSVHSDFSVSCSVQPNRS